MIISPYETSILKGSGTQTLVNEVSKAVISGDVVEIVGYEADRDFDVYALVEKNEHVSIFYHPIPLELPHRRPCIVYDARMYASAITVENTPNGKTGKITGVNESLNLLQITAVLMGIWRETPNQVINVSDVPMTVYGSLLTETLSRRLGLDPAAQLTVMAAFQLFYATRGFKSLSRIEEADKTLLMTSLSKRLGVTPDTFSVVLDAAEEGDFENFAGIVRLIRRMNLSPRLEKISPADIFGMVMNSWVGQGNPRETMMLAIEFPPVFVAITYIMARSTFYQKLPIGQIIKRINRGNNLKNFTQQLTYLLR